MSIRYKKAAGARSRDVLVVACFVGLCATGLGFAGGRTFGTIVQQESPRDTGHEATDESRVHSYFFGVPTGRAGHVAPVISAHEGNFYERSAQEWQGMLVSKDTHPLCDTSERCGLALACRNWQCGPCGRDAHCAAGEICVLDRCLLAANVGCRSSRDCNGEKNLCMLTELSPEARGNRNLRSLCFSEVRVPTQEEANRLPAPRKERRTRKGRYESSESIETALLLDTLEDLLTKKVEQ